MAVIFWLALTRQSNPSWSPQIKTTLFHFKPVLIQGGAILDDKRRVGLRMKSQKPEFPMITQIQAKRVTAYARHG